MLRVRFRAPTFDAAQKVLAAMWTPGPLIWWLPAAVTGAELYLAISIIGNMQSKFIYFNF
jgi:hypothetical protein